MWRVDSIFSKSEYFITRPLPVHCRMSSLVLAGCAAAVRLPMPESRFSKNMLVWCELFRSLPQCLALLFLLTRPAGHFGGRCRRLVGQDQEEGHSQFPPEGAMTGSVR